MEFVLKPQMIASSAEGATPKPSTCCPFWYVKSIAAAAAKGASLVVAGESVAMQDYTVTIPMLKNPIAVKKGDSLVRVKLG